MPTAIPAYITEALFDTSVSDAMMRQAQADVDAKIVEIRNRRAPNFRPKRPKRSFSPVTLPHDVLAGVIGALAPDDVKALHYIANNADLIIVAGEAFLLTPAPAALLDILATIGADTEDNEPSLGRPEGINQAMRCQGSGDDLEYDADDDGAIETDADDEDVILVNALGFNAGYETGVLSGTGTAVIHVKYDGTAVVSGRTFQIQRINN